ncbi:MAG TPA: FAD-dependent oxidoreductase, partial [Kiritimatiellia bacterium]|nr:FAD-dependent oxidoreductase [Kiritimatiellia bacterium]
IYIAFTLILWTAPVWSIDRMLFTFGWTIYCVMGALLKERRHERILGAAYAAYQRRVPFWFPRLRRRTDTAPSAPATDVVIVGAGPVGLLLANLLAREGLSVALLEARREPRSQSMAIGITPPSLDILETLGLAEAFLNAGVRIRGAFVHETGSVTGALAFETADSARPYILSLPQLETERLLADRLAAEPRVAIHRGWSVESIEQDRDGVRVTATETHTGRECVFAARFAVGCDGAHSAVRALAGFRVRRKDYAPAFTMADYVDTTALGATAHLFFGEERPVESFPLPGGLRRWIIRTGWRDETDLVEPLEASIARLTGFVLPAAACVWRSGFRPRRHEATRFQRGRVVLCGDAAHGMSPIGGQGMNTGFGDATHLACALAGILRYNGNPHALLAGYERARRHAFRRAAARAAIGMALGTWTGPARSRIRAALVAVLLGHAATHRAAARWFTMRSLPEPIVLKSVNA